MGELTFNTLESVAGWGIPVALDDSPLTLTQARVLAGMVEKFMDEAGHPKEYATKLAVGVFRRMYDLREGGWQAKSSIKVGKAQVRSKFHKVDRRERIMARAKAPVVEQAGPFVKLLQEAGARHARVDKERIFGAVRSLLAALNKEDQEGLLKDVRTKNGLSLRLRAAPAGNSALTPAPAEGKQGTR